MDVALADMLEKYQRNPNPPLARTIELIREEIELKNSRVHDGGLLIEPGPICAQVPIKMTKAMGFAAGNPSYGA